MFDHPLALELAYIAVEEAIRLGASYADARYELRHEEQILTSNGRLEHVSTGLERGLGLRVLVRGSWGFVGISEPNRHDVAVAARRAVETARAAAILQDQPVELARQTPQRSLFRTQIRRDPLAVPVEDKVALLLGLDDKLRSVAGVSLARSHFSALRQRRIFVSSEGSELDQELVTTGVGCQAGAVDADGALQIRSFPGGPQGLVLGRGWEVVSELGLDDAAVELAEEAVALSKAAACPNDALPTILTGNLLAHHVLGTTAHLFELDRMVGLTKGDTGGSFLHADQLGRLELGGEHLHLYADAREPGGAGTFGFDDEGVEAQRVDLVAEGRFIGVLSGRETAHRVGLQQSQGAMRAASWAAPPMVRPTNVSLAPGQGGSLDDLIADTKQGILLDGPRTFSVDPFGRTFTATAEVAWEIKDGKKGRMLRNPIYQGATLDLWRSCDALTDETDWSMYGGYGLAKGRPGQRVPVGVGASSARFTRVEVGTHHRRPPRVDPDAPLPLLDDARGGSAPSGRKVKSRTAAKKKSTKRRVKKKDTK
ncbi:MAG: TldD/PmbA family protein [Deltaproteobacteria bacterium]|nr:TldD/PmbA family protein [Deltaproteobacteria bacterium]